MDPIRKSYDERLRLLLDETVSHDITSDEFATATKNLTMFSAIRTSLPEPDPETTPVPATRLARAMAAVGSALDNETTRVLIKAGGAFAGVGLVVWSTVHRDHVLDKQAVSQANLRNN